MNVTGPLPKAREWARISIVEASRHNARTACVAANRFQQDVFEPYLFRTTDCGQTHRVVHCVLHRRRTACRTAAAAPPPRWTEPLRVAHAACRRGRIRWGHHVAVELTGPLVALGTCTFTMRPNGAAPVTGKAQIFPDPRSDAKPADQVAQAALLKRLSDRISEANRAVASLRRIRAQCRRRWHPPTRRRSLR